VAVLLVSNLVISILLATGLQTIMNFVEKLQIATHFTAINLIFPANAKIFFGCLIHIA
jgi:hypothetical protein